MKKILLSFFILINISSCGSSSRRYEEGRSSKVLKIEHLEDILNLAEEESTEAGKRVLQTSRAMIANKEIVVGGCWNYINTVYDRVGFTMRQRETVYKSKLKGPYVSPKIVQPGDWLYFVNHTYSDSEHSAIFVAWTDKSKKEALMVSYVGENHKKPAFYKKFILDNIYSVIRGREIKALETAYSK